MLLFRIIDSDYEIDGAADSDEMESEETSASDSSEYEPGK